MSASSPLVEAPEAPDRRAWVALGTVTSSGVSQLISQEAAEAGLQRLLGDGARRRVAEQPGSAHQRLRSPMLVESDERHEQEARFAEPRARRERAEPQPPGCTAVDSEVRAHGLAVRPGEQRSGAK